MDDTFQNSVINYKDQSKVGIKIWKKVFEKIPNFNSFDPKTQTSDLRIPFFMNNKFYYYSSSGSLRYVYPEIEDLISLFEINTHGNYFVIYRFDRKEIKIDDIIVNLFNCIGNLRERKYCEYEHQKKSFHERYCNWWDKIKYDMGFKKIKIKDIFFEYRDKIDKDILLNESLKKFKKKEITPEKYIDLVEYIVGMKTYDKNISEYIFGTCNPKNVIPINLCECDGSQIYTFGNGNYTYLYYITHG